MKRWLSYFTVLVVLAVCGLGSAAAQNQSRAGTVIVPPSNVELPQNIGRRAHTNFLIFVPAARSQKGHGPSPNSVPSGETPGSLSCIYQTWAGQISGCPVNGSYKTPSGGSNVIAIVDAYDYPTAAADFNTFSQQFGLPTTGCDGNSADSCLKVVYATGSVPQSNCSWAQEEALDIEWAHAMAPDAQIILVEAASNSNADLMSAVKVASGLVASAGGGEVSMSWGGSEFSTQSTYDTYFTGKGVSFFASSGDTGGKVIWPSTSPDVISAGGTSVNRDSSGNFTGETVWSSAGAGPSKLEPAPAYQTSINSLASLLNGFRGTPDISFDADPYTGVAVYDSTSCQGLSGWLVFGGTSVASPSLAGIFNLAGAFSGGWDSGANANSVQNYLYQNYNNVSNGGASTPYPNTFYDVTSGSTGSYTAGSDWDFASGIGSDRGLTGMLAPVTGAPVAPTGLTATPGNAQVSLSWTASSGATSYNVLRSTTSGSGYAQINPNPVTTTTYVDTSVTNGTTYYYVVEAVDSEGTSGYSNQASATPGAATPDFSISASPTSQTISAGGSATYTVSVGSSGSFSGSVSLSVSGLQKFMHASFSTNPVSVSANGSASSDLSVSTNRHVASGTYTLTITGTSGSLTHTYNVSLNVQ